MMLLNHVCRKGKLSLLRSFVLICTIAVIELPVDQQRCHYGGRNSERGSGVSEEVRRGFDDETFDYGCEVGGNPDPIRVLVHWTNDVIALQRASFVFPSIEAVIDDCARTCWLCCGSRDNAVEVYRYLEEHAEEMCLLPELVKEKARVYVMYHDFD
jgi:hypothetical protein